MGYFRHPQTTQERRKWFIATNWQTEFPQLKLRKARSFRLLPNTYDDIYANSENSWKKHRMTQYRVKQVKTKKSSTRYGIHMSRRGHGWTQHKSCYHRPCNYCKRHGIIYCGSKEKLYVTYCCTYFC